MVMGAPLLCKGEKMQQKIDWIYHYVGNGVPCAICGKVEDSFPPGICDAHTHGMDKYGHPEFQVIIDGGPQETGRLLNTMGLRVQSGERFKSGDEIEGLYLDCNVQLREMPDANGKPVLRLVIPDAKNRLPEEGADYPYCLQVLATPVFYIGTGLCKCAGDDDEN